MFEKPIAKTPVFLALALGVLSSGCAMKAPTTAPAAVGLTQAPAAAATAKYNLMSVANTKNSKASKNSRNSKASKNSKMSKNSKVSMKSKNSLRSNNTKNTKNTRTNTPVYK